MENQIVEQVLPVTEEKIYRYQPTDETGRPIGGAQVIKYTTAEELADKLRDQNVLLVRKLREQTRKVRLGVVEEEEISDDTQRFNGPVEFNPRELTEEQRYDISRRLLDPTTAADAAAELVEARLGAPLESIGATLRTVQQDNIALRANAEAHAFTAENPDYYKCPENQEAITSWMLRYNLAPVKANFQKAYDTLKLQGILVEGGIPVPPVAELPVEVAVPVVENEVIREELPAQPVQPYRGVPSGLNRENASDAGTPLQPGGEITYVLNGRTLTGLAAVAAMPGDEYKKRLLTDREFSKKVDRLESEARKPRQ